MQRERPVCVTCGKHFQFDDFTEELGELIACPYCGSFEIEIELLTEEAETGEPASGDARAHAA